MTPEEIQRTIDFILQSQANAAVRLEGLQEKLDTLVGVTAQFVTTMRVSEESNRGWKARADENFLLLTRIAASHSNRLDRLET